MKIFQLIPIVSVEATVQSSSNRNSAFQLIFLHDCGHHPSVRPGSFIRKSSGLDEWINERSLYGDQSSCSGTYRQSVRSHYIPKRWRERQRLFVSFWWTWSEWIERSVDPFYVSEKKSNNSWRPRAAAWRCKKNSTKLICRHHTTTRSRWRNSMARSRAV